MLRCNYFNFKCKSIKFLIVYLKFVLVNHENEKNKLNQQCILFQDQIDILMRESFEKNNQIKELQIDADRHKSNIATAEIQLDMLRAKVNLIKNIF